MQKISNPLDDAWFVDNSKSTSRIISVDTSNYNFTIEGLREIIVKNDMCECGQKLEQKWRYCPQCGGKLVWEQ